MKPLVSLRRFLSLQFAAVAAVPVVIIAVMVWLLLMPQMRTSIGIQQQSLARAIAGQIYAHLMGGERQLRALADFVDTQGAMPASQMSALLDTQCGDGDLFETIYISEKHNEMIASVGLSRPRRSGREDLLGLDISARGFYRKAHESGKTLWSETFLSTASSRLAVAVTVPLSDGVIIGEITLDHLSEFISHLPVETGLLTMRPLRSRTMVSRPVSTGK